MSGRILSDVPTVFFRVYGCILTIMCLCSCLECGTAVRGRWPTHFQPSSTSRHTVTFLQMETTWCPAAMASEARAVRPRWDRWVERADQTVCRLYIVWVMSILDGHLMEHVRLVLSPVWNLALRAGGLILCAHQLMPMLNFLFFIQ